jgi:hypothetical protein
MRFINTTSLRFQVVPDLELPKLKNGYSVLSHRWTWAENEIQFADVLSKEPDLKKKDGYAKFGGACALAKTLGYDWLWIDTCCINKTDHVELGEAINSMYRWYSNSALCIAYLEDVASSADIRQSEWFNRGWTLQELIAPKNVRFYGCSWNYLGDKTSLGEVLVDKTGIPTDIFQRTKNPQAYSVAQRMSWAAKRTTTRIEDRAYSLMGLFDVTMPMIYGERERAFMRLQEHIIAKSADESIFVWDLDLLEDSKRDAKHVHCGMLATSPACFARCGNVITIGRSRGFGINQFGLTISLPATQYTLRTYCAPLKVTKERTAGQCALLLSRLPDGDSFARTSSATGESIMMAETLGDKLTEFIVPLEPRETPVHLYPGFWLRKMGFFDPQITHFVKFSRLYATDTDRLTLPDGVFGTAGVIRIQLQSQHYAPGWMKFGFDSDSNPMCFVTFPSIDRERSYYGQYKILDPSEFGRSPDRAKHPIFSDEWIHASHHTMSTLPKYSYDSRMSSSSIEDGFEFTFRAPLFEISVSATKVPDIKSTGNEVWAVDIVAGKGAQQPFGTFENDSSCCC